MGKYHKIHKINFAIWITTFTESSLPSIQDCICDRLMDAVNIGTKDATHITVHCNLPY